MTRIQKLAAFVVGLAALSVASPAYTQQIIKIGVVGALTGPLAASGQSQLTGAEMRKVDDAASIPSLNTIPSGSTALGWISALVTGLRTGSICSSM